MPKKNGPVHAATDHIKTRQLIDKMELLKRAFDKTQGKKR